MNTLQNNGIISSDAIALSAGVYSTTGLSDARGAASNLADLYNPLNWFKVVEDHDASTDTYTYSKHIILLRAGQITTIPSANGADAYIFYGSISKALINNFLIGYRKGFASQQEAPVLGDDDYDDYNSWQIAKTEFTKWHLIGSGTISTVYDFKGTVASEAALSKVVSPTKGDVYVTENTGRSYVYDGNSNWIELSILPSGVLTSILSNLGIGIKVGNSENLFLHMQPEDQDPNLVLHASTISSTQTDSIVVQNKAIKENIGGNNTDVYPLFMGISETLYPNIPITLNVTEALTEDVLKTKLNSFETQDSIGAIIASKYSKRSNNDSTPISYNKNVLYLATGVTGNSNDDLVVGSTFYPLMYRGKEVTFISGGHYKIELVKCNTDLVINIEPLSPTAAITTYEDWILDNIALNEYTEEVSNTTTASLNPDYAKVLYQVAKKFYINRASSTRRPNILPALRYKFIIQNADKTYSNQYVDAVMTSVRQIDATEYEATFIVEDIFIKADLSYQGDATDDGSKPVDLTLSTVVDLQLLNTRVTNLQTLNGWEVVEVDTRPTVSTETTETISD